MECQINYKCRTVAPDNIFKKLSMVLNFFQLIKLWKASLDKN